MTICSIGPRARAARLGPARRSRPALEALGDATLARGARLALRRGAAPSARSAAAVPGGPPTVLRAVGPARRRSDVAQPARRGPAGVPRARSRRRPTTRSTPGRSATSRRRRCRCRSPARSSPDGRNQGVDVWHAGPVRRVRRGGGHRLAPRPARHARRGSWGVLTSGGVMANLMALDRRPRRLARRRFARPAGPPRGAAARRRAGLRERPDALLDRARARRARVPATARCACSRCDDAFRLRPEPVAEAIARRPRRRTDTARDRRRRGLDEHRLGRRRPGLAEVAERGRACGSTSTPRTGARPGSRRATRTAGAGPRARRLASPSTPQVVLPGLRHRRARRAPARGPAARPSTARPSTTARTDPRTSPSTGTEYSIEGTRRFRALKLWMSWKHLGTAGLGRLIERERRPGRLPRRADPPRRPTSRTPPRARALRGLLPPPAGRPRRAGRRSALDAYQAGLQRALEVTATHG